MGRKSRFLATLSKSVSLSSRYKAGTQMVRSFRPRPVAIVAELGRIEPFG
jgi:hypothetical protein